MPISFSLPSILTSARTSVGKKFVMGLSGVILCGFVFVHMTGNLLLYRGPEALNAYAALLKTNAPVLWGARAVLLLAVAAHSWAAFSLIRTNNAARPIGYRAQTFEASTYASRTMRFGGPTLLLFIVYHLLHFTVGAAHPDFRGADVYHNVVTGFQSPIVASFYVFAMLALALHLFHGFVSMLQTLGLSHPQYDLARRALGAGFAAVVTLGNLSFPLSVAFGLVK
jgi:succinate dehydrogenase / fumarate reductase cytochrome b subunit